jgi:threonine/homoserine/homoserine lactone efflux protein
MSLVVQVHVDELAMGIHDLWLFLLAGVVLNVTPGQDMALIIARSTQFGTRAGVAAALGVGVGAFVHIFAAAIGISTLIVASAFAFAVLKWIGAAYLTYLGIQLLRSSFLNAPPASTRPLRSNGLREVFLQGVLTNALNPKVAMFFLAFLPQFVDADAPAKVTSFITLGLLFNVIGTTWNIGVALLAGKFATSPAYVRMKAWLERTLGTLFVLVGIKLALTERP